MKFQKKLFILLGLFLTIFTVYSQQNNKAFTAKEYGVIKSNRDDNRYLSSRGVVHSLLKNNTPQHSFNTNFSKSNMKSWQSDISKAMIELMKHPQIKNLPDSKLINTYHRNGYIVEKWEAYPLPECVVPYLVLIPENKINSNNTPAVLCITGSGLTKESAAGEEELNINFSNGDNSDKYLMALPFVKEGLIAVVVDNPGAGELSDLEKHSIAPNYQYDAVARYLLELDWSYLGYSSYINMHILNWMKTHPLINKDKLILCGFSLGTEPLMVLGAMDKSIHAFIFNDFVCRTLERMIVLTEPNRDGVRPFPNSIRHLVPGFLKSFDFPDILASLAPRPLICTEGGLDRDLNMIKDAYSIMEAPNNVEIHHYIKFADSPRGKYEKLPEGLGQDLYFSLTNVDPPNHSIKMEYILPWLKNILTNVD